MAVFAILIAAGIPGYTVEDKDMDCTAEFFELAGINGTPVSSSSSDFLSKAMETHRDISAFEKLIYRLRESFINFHRFIPVDSQNVKHLTESDRNAISQEIVSFITTASSQIQSLNRQLEEAMGEEERVTATSQHYRLIIASLLSKLSGFTARTDRMQKEYRKRATRPCRMMSDRYFGCVRDIKESPDEPQASVSALSVSFFGSSASKAVVDNSPAEDSPVVAASATAAQDTFAQRYVDEIASSSKMREYTAIASRQKDSLVKEAKILKAKFSEEMQESQKMERTVNNISSMISEFVQLIESQSALVDTIGEVSQDTSSSVKSADAELLLTLERSQSHQWSMLLFVAGMACLLLLLDFISP